MLETVRVYALGAENGASILLDDSGMDPAMVRLLLFCLSTSLIVACSRSESPPSAERKSDSDARAEVKVKSAPKKKSSAAAAVNVCELLTPSHAGEILDFVPTKAVPFWGMGNGASCLYSGQKPPQKMNVVLKFHEDARSALGETSGIGRSGEEVNLGGAADRAYRLGTTFGLAKGSVYMSIVLPFEESGDLNDKAARVAAKITQRLEN